MNDEKPNDHAGDMGFNDAPKLYTCSVCDEEYWNRPSLEGEHQMCDDCYRNKWISISAGIVEPSWPQWIQDLDPTAIASDDAVEFIKQAYQEGRQSWPKWISVKERLPELRVPVLVWDNKNKSRRIEVLAGISESGVPVWYGYVVVRAFESPPQFTHWLPLPPAPEGE